MIEKFKKRNKSLLFKNIFIQNFKNRLQLVVMVMLLLITSLIFMLTILTNETINNSVENTNTRSNLHDFIIDFNSASYIGPEPSSELQTSMLEQHVVDNSSSSIENNEFVWDRVETRNFYFGQPGKNQKVLKVIAYNKDARVDKLVITDGYAIGENTEINSQFKPSQQIVVDSTFAKLNNLKIGSIMRIQPDSLGSTILVNNNNTIEAGFNWFKIVGFGNSADYQSPIINQQQIIPNKNLQGVVYIDPSQYGLSEEIQPDGNIFWNYTRENDPWATVSKEDNEIYYVGKFKNDISNLHDVNLIKTYLQDYYSPNASNPDNYFVYALGDKNYRYNSRIENINIEVIAFNSFMTFLLIIILSISSILLFLVVQKNVNFMKKQLGILKALGYNNFRIVISFLAIPTIFVFFSVLFTYPLAIGAQFLTINIAEKYTNIIFQNSVNWLYTLKVFIFDVIMLFTFLMLISIITSGIMISKKPLKLLYNYEKMNNYYFVKLIKKPYKDKAFSIRFQMSIFAQSLTKMLIVLFTIFVGTFLLSFIFITPDVMNNNLTYSFKGQNYNNITTYTKPVYNSPFSFLKTYNPVAENNTNYPMGSPENIFYNFSSDNQDSLSSDTFALNPSNSTIVGTSMSNLTYKVFTKYFLNNIDDNLEEPKDSISGITWSDYDVMSSAFKSQSDPSTESISDIYNEYRNFYQLYKNTINLNINPYFRKDDLSILPESLNALDQNKFKNYFNDNYSLDNDIFDFDSLDFSKNGEELKINNDSDFLNYSYDNLPNKEEASKFIHCLNTIFGSVFFGRLSQAIVQETYIQSPYNVRSELKTNLESDDVTQYNLAFGLATYDPLKDELDTLINANDNSLNFNIYGLQSNSNIMKLSDGKENLNNKIVNPSDTYKVSTETNFTEEDNSINYNIVINKTLANKLNWSKNKIYKLEVNNSALQYKDSDSYNDIKVNDFKYDDSLFGSDQRYNDYKTISLNQSGSTNIYDPGLNGRNADWTVQNAQNRNLKMTPTTKDINVKVVGISNNYGTPSAYINNEDANHLMGYDISRDYLYKLFKTEWTYYSSILADGINGSSLPEDFNSFKEQENKYPTWWRTFNSEYPIFNYKMSQNNQIDDLTYGTSVNNVYGDYTKIGLNGGSATTGITSSDSKEWGRLGTGTINLALSHEQYEAYLENIYVVIDIVLAIFGIIAISMSIIIMALVTNVIFHENKRSILTMKVIGYKDNYITWTFFGFYLPVSILVFLVIYPIIWLFGKFIFNKISNSITTMYLPYFFTLWIPFVVLGIILLIYFILFMINYWKIRKLKANQVLKEIN